MHAIKEDGEAWSFCEFPHGIKVKALLQDTDIFFKAIDDCDGRRWSQ